MRKTILLFLTIVTLSSCEVFEPGVNNYRTGGYTESEAAKAIKQALGQGLGKAVLQLNTTDGFSKMLL